MKVLYDAGRYVEFKDGREAAAQTAYTGEIQGLSAGCAYKDDEPIKVQVQMLFELGQRPAGDRRPEDLPLLGGGDRAQPGRSWPRNISTCR